MKTLTIAVCAALTALSLASSAIAASSADLAPGARSAALIDASDGAVLWEKNANERLPMASTTKIMTALVAIERLPPDREVEAIPEACGVEGSSIYMKPGERFTVEELLYATLLQSANDAATLLAIETAGSVGAFAGLMNEKAAALGLSDTRFENPHGLDADGHFTSARDLAALASAALRDPTFRGICSTYRRTIGEGESARTLVNHNRMLLLYDGATGVKTGFTKKSGRCLVTAAERDGVTLVSVTLNDGDDWRDHEAMLDFGFSQLESVTLCEAGGIERTLPCVGGSADGIRVSNADAVTATLRKGRGEVSVRVFAPHFLFAPVGAGDAVGTAVFFCDGREVGRCALSALDASEYIPEKGFFERLLDLYR